MLSNLIQKINRRRAIWSFLRRYPYLIEVNKLLEEYQTKLLIDGGSDEFIAQTRKQLLNTQGEIRSHQDFINWLKTK